MIILCVTPMLQCTDLRFMREWAPYMYNSSESERKLRAVLENQNDDHSL